MVTRGVGVECVRVSLNYTSGDGSGGCDCPDVIREALCQYSMSVLEEIEDTSIWKVYVILTELMVKVIPAILVIALNILMIRV